MGFNRESKVPAPDEIARQFQTQQAANERLRGKKTMAELDVATEGLSWDKLDEVANHLIHARTGGLTPHQIMNMIDGMTGTKPG